MQARFGSCACGAGTIDLRTVNGKVMLGRSKTTLALDSALVCERFGAALRGRVRARGR